ncbi:MAG TPA: DGQHR domain-containing protein [Gemmatimonadaceae bacterium]|nr:DGQHR domain-containing protein [Gemmatimonadaceae bacterium]
MTQKSATRAKRKPLAAQGIVLRDEPAVYMTALPGPWLLDHSTPSWRIEDPKKGFQRIVKDQRAKEIARTVLDAHRTFPNAITLATTAKRFPVVGDSIQMPGNSKFLVVDGQHRLWAQKHSKVSGSYPCIIHMDRTEQQMAELFLEINDNQRRVPSSLRWDLVRLVRNADQSRLITVDVIFELATRKESPFFSAGVDNSERVGIDLTGEKKFLIKQGSLAPEIELLVKRHLRKTSGDLEEYLGLLIRFFVAIRSLDPDGWGDPQSTFYKARVLRALLRVLSDILDTETTSDLTTARLREHLDRIDRTTLSPDEVRRMQGSAGVQDLYKQIRGQILGSETS